VSKQSDDDNTDETVMSRTGFPGARRCAEVKTDKSIRRRKALNIIWTPH
jgi:hypothetical protein